ncbi:MAG: DNA polymerase III subunit alpha [Elusimicrobia bacterium]|nr:DNA polymerase III subunit alpha [Elusimicrobiota bacterium]
MGKSEFVHLHNHSEYSLLDGIIRFTEKDPKDKKDKPAELLRNLAKDYAKGMALTDHGNMYGAVEFYNQCRAVGLKPIIGMEAYFSKGTRTDRGHSQKENCHLTLLSRDYAGYQNLMELSSKAFLEGYYYDPRIDRELLSKYGKGLVAMSGCLKGELAQRVLRGDDIGQVCELAVDYRDRLEPGCFFLEIMDHGLPEQKQVIKVFLEVSKKTGIPLVATNDCHFVKKSDAEAQDARICIATGRRMDDSTRLHHESREYYYKSPEEMTTLFPYVPEACASTLKIAEMCNLQIPMDQMLLPEFQVPQGYTQDSYLEELCIAGLQERFSGATPAPHQDRLKYELGVIRRMGFSGYFLIVWDFIKYARSIGVPVGPGRGSGAGALVAYALRITNLDPIEHQLLFERFLNPDRKSMPDLDIDFADTGRDRVIEYVRNKYGADNVAQIVTFGSLGAKLVVRDVGRVLGVPLPEVDKLAKLIPGVPGTMLFEAIQKTPELAEAYKNPQYKKLLTLSLKLEGLKRHTGVHAAGTVITKEPVVRYTPLARARETVTTQYEGNILPNLGLLKVDFLGLRTLSIIDNAVKAIRSRGKPDFDIDRIPMDDAKSFELLRSGKALGVFQLDSQGIRDLMVRVKPTEFSDIVALIALYRPGPMGAGMLDMFVNRKHGREKVKYDSKLMEPVLKDTYGCMLYQEQIMELSKRLAGFTPGEADGLRKAMSKKVPEDLAKARDKFVKGGAVHDINAKTANKIYDQMEKFAGYGFNKSHSAAYGLVAYQTAYLKANYPLEFMSALATSEIGHSAVGSEGKENKLVTYLEDAKSMGITILPPSLQTSGAVFTIEDPGSIRFGLTAVKNVGEGAVDSILQARRGGPFKSLDDFCSRVDLRGVNKKVIESLIKAGAMDSLEPGQPVGAARGRLIAAVSDAVDRQQKVQADLSRGQGLLFGMGDMPGSAQAQDAAAAPAPVLHEHDVLAFEKEVLGFYLSGHPLLGVRSLLQAAATHEISRLTAEITKSVRLAGMISQVKRMVTKKDGKQYAKAVLEDLSGEITLLVFPQKYAEGLGAQLKVGAIVCVEGKLLFQGDAGESAVPELSVQDILPLETAASRNAKRLRLACDPDAMGDTALEALREVLERRPGPCPVILEHETLEGTAILELDSRVSIDKNLLESITKILGEKSWRIESAS